jgi:1-acyl-sn-glycerol-3-phosphate acyltransferase
MLVARALTGSVGAAAWPLALAVYLGAVGLVATFARGAGMALLPALAHEASVRLARIHAWMGAAAAAVGCVFSWSGLSLADGNGPLALPAALYLLSFLLAWPVHRAPGATAAPLGFVPSVRRVLGDARARASLVGLIAFEAVALAGVGALVVPQDPRDGADLLTALAAGAIGGYLTAGLQGHLRRHTGLILYAAAGLCLALSGAALAAAFGVSPGVVTGFLLGFLGALVHAPLRYAFLTALPVEARAQGMAVRDLTGCLLALILALLLFAVQRAGLPLPPAAVLTGLAVLAAVATVLAWKTVLGQAFEMAMEWLIAPMYHVRAHGPGLEQVPLKGPLLLVANHSAYFDPFWLFKLMPRHLMPMMTSSFFDRPVVHWLMADVIRAIRVQDSGFRREAPELDRAVTMLRQGECLLVFPEAMLRRKEDQLIRPFGQGVWRILQELPQTPVIVCWIEGGWGSYTSYHGGPPTKNKRPDWRRPINVGFAEPRVLPPEVLADHRATRQYLMRACLECRRYLGLPVPTDAEAGKDELDEAQADTHQINP